MRSHRCVIACGWLAAVLMACGFNPRFSANAAGPPSDWKVFEGFPISVDVYARQSGSDKPSASKEKSEPIASYTMHAVLQGVLPFEECGCWKLQFASFSKQPEFKDSFRLWIDKNDGHTRKASRFTGPTETPLPPASIAAIVLDAPPGYPIELIPDMEDPTIPTPRAGTTLEISSRAIEGASERKAILRVDDKPEIEIRQRWLPGAKWWSEYERFYRGRRELHARLFTPKTAPAAPPPAVPPRPPSPADGLRADPRLQVRLSTDFHHRPVQDVLERLSRETNVPLTMEDSLAATVPYVGSFSLRNVPAWKVMHRLAGDFVKDGRWEKTDTGYQLSASRAVLPRVPPEYVSQRNWLLFWMFAPLVPLGIAYWYLHKRRGAFHPVSGPEERTADGRGT